MSQDKKNKNKNGVPDRWLNYRPMGRRIPGTRFIAFKVPLKPSLNCRVPESDSFGLWDLLDSLESQNQELGLIIDLTFTTKYYNLTDVPQSCSYIKILTKGHHVPSDATILRFKRAVRCFLKENQDNNKLIGVHCTHGLNRTGYLVCRYLIDVDGLDPLAALELFNSCRGHHIERKNYLHDLKRSAKRSNKGIDESEEVAAAGLAVERPPASTARGPPAERPPASTARGPPAERPPASTARGPPAERPPASTARGLPAERPLVPPPEDFQQNARRPPPPEDFLRSARRPPPPEDLLRSARRPPPPEDFLRSARRPPPPEDFQRSARRPPPPEDHLRRACRPPPPEVLLQSARRPPPRGHNPPVMIQLMGNVNLVTAAVVELDIAGGRARRHAKGLHREMTSPHLPSPPREERDRQVKRQTDR